MFLKSLYWVFVTFQFKVGKTYFILWTICIRLCWLHVHNGQDNALCGHKKIVSQLCLYFLRNTPQNKLCWCLEPDHEQESFCIFIKSIEMSFISDTLPSISQSWVDFEQSKNKFLDPLGECQRLGECEQLPQDDLVVAWVITNVLSVPLSLIPPPLGNIYTISSPGWPLAMEISHSGHWSSTHFILTWRKGEV